MSERSLPELIDTFYPDRGGYAKLRQIFDGNKAYELKLREAQDTFIKSRSTVSAWYSRYLKQQEISK